MLTSGGSVLGIIHTLIKAASLLRPRSICRSANAYETDRFLVRGM